MYSFHALNKASDKITIKVFGILNIRHQFFFEVDLMPIYFKFADLVVC